MDDFKYQSEIITQRRRYRWQSPRLLLNLIPSDIWIIRDALKLLLEDKEAYAARLRNIIDEGRERPGYGGTRHMLESVDRNILQVAAMLKLLEELDRRRADILDKAVGPILGIKKSGGAE